MEPFSFLCQTCAARLKVRDASVIGQSLACPKCQNMVLVVAPAGHVVDTPEASKEDDTELSDFDFGDVDNLIRSPEASAAPKPKSKNLATAPIRKPKRLQNNTKSAHPQTHSPKNETAVLPNDQWTSESTKQRRKFVVIGATVFASILLVSTLVAAIWINRGDQTTPIVEDSETSIPKVVINTGDDLSDKTDPQNVESSSTDPAPDSSADTASETPETDQSVNSTDETNPDSPNPAEPNAVDPSDPDELKAPTVPIETDIDSATNDETPVQPVRKRRPGQGLDLLIGGNKNQGQTNATDLENKMGELSKLLNQKGTSLSEIIDMAVMERDEQLVGLPKYYFDCDDPFDADSFKYLADPVSSVEYDDTPLLYILRDISEMTGVPFQINLDAFHSNSLNVATPTGFKASDTDFMGVVQTMLESHGLTLAFDNQSIPVVTQSDFANLIEKKYPIPNFSDKTAEQLNGFALSIRTFISPDSWDAENGGSISVTDTAFVISQTASTHRRIQNLFEKINAALEITNGGPATPEVFQSPWVAAAAKLAVPFKSEFRTPVRLETMLNQIHKVSGISIVVDWHSAMQLNWTPETMVPGRMNEESVRHAIRQIARTLNMTYRFIDDSTIELTSFEKAVSAQEIAVYPCRKIIDGNLNENQLLEALRLALGSDLARMPNVRVVYHEDCQAIIAAAPQSVQRQIQAIVKRLAEN